MKPALKYLQVGHLKKNREVLVEEKKMHQERKENKQKSAIRERSA